LEAIFIPNVKFILGTKEEMTQVFDDKGVVHAGTIITVGDVVVTQVKTKATDGYGAVQIGYGLRKEKNTPKAQKGHLKDLALFHTLKEFRDAEGFTRGDKIDLSIFKMGDKVEVSATSKGKGFQGVVKRHGFHGGPRSHGQKHNERSPGSIGGSGRAGGRVAKGMKMGGRMGTDRVTVKNLKVLAVDPKAGMIVISGAVPGRRGTLVEIVSTDK
jgi:large subunit ribosomal protein L3